MNDLKTAAQANDVGRLRQLLENRKAAQSSSQGLSEEQNSSHLLQEACEAAARNNHPAALEVLLNEGGKIERWIISAAAWSGSIDVFKLLIARGWEVNEPLGRPGDALITAINAENLELVKFLIAHGADPNANLWMELCTPLECAVFSSELIMKALVHAGAEIKGRSALQTAAYHGKTAATSYLLDCGAPIDEVPNDGSSVCRSALGGAAFQGHVEVVKLLLEKGADVDVKDTNGKSALDLAEMKNRDVCVDILREASGLPRSSAVGAH